MITKHSGGESSSHFLLGGPLFFSVAISLDWESKQIKILSKEVYSPISPTDALPNNLDVYLYVLIFSVILLLTAIVVHFLVRYYRRKQKQ